MTFILSLIIILSVTWIIKIANEHRDIANQIENISSAIEDKNEELKTLKDEIPKEIQLRLDEVNLAIAQLERVCSNINREIIALRIEHPILIHHPYPSSERIKYKALQKAHRKCRNEVISTSPCA